MFEKLLVLSTSAGAGHVHAAEALVDAVRRHGAAREVDHVDMLDYTNRLFQGIYRKLYLEIVDSAPDVFGWLYEATDNSSQSRKRRLAFEKLNTRPFVKMLEQRRPDLVVCTHFLPAEIISWLREQKRLDCPQAVVMTDFDLHAMWLCRHCEHYFTHLEETAVHLSAVGVPRERITVSGIPIDRRFGEALDRAKLRERLGLDPERTTLLLSTGGFGVGPVERIVSDLLEMGRPAELLVVSGRNAELADWLDARAAEQPSNPRVRLHPFGFVRNMHELMAASDLIIGKPGGLTTAEALASGLVFVIMNPVPGQEERNADHLLEENAAIRCNNLPALRWKVEQLLSEPERLERMRSNARRLARPDAADVIVKKLLELNPGQIAEPIGGPWP